MDSSFTCCIHPCLSLSVLRHRTTNLNASPYSNTPQINSENVQLPNLRLQEPARGLRQLRAAQEVGVPQPRRRGGPVRRGAGARIVEYMECPKCYRKRKGRERMARGGAKRSLKEGVKGLVTGKDGQVSGATDLYALCRGCWLTDSRRKTDEERQRLVGEKLSPSKRLCTS